MLRQITLHGRLVHLAPLRASHADDLWPVANDPLIWRVVAAEVESPGDLAGWIDDRLTQADQGAALAFIQRAADTGMALGSTSLYDIDLDHGTMEIGHTWLTPDVWGTPINTEAKLLLLEHAFTQLGAGRVQLKADARNTRSQRAIEKLGATREGTLRNVQRLPDGTPRDMVHYSVLDTEWPRVRALLQHRLEQASPPSHGAPATATITGSMMPPRARARQAATVPSEPPSV